MSDHEQSKPDLLNAPGYMGEEKSVKRKLNKAAAERRRQYLLDNGQKLRYHQRSYNGDQFYA